MKRKLDVMQSPCPVDCDDLPASPSPPPPKRRMSILHNTPKQWKEQRRRLLNLSKQKLKAIVDVETNLRKSVLINNTYRQIKHQMKYCASASEAAAATASYTPRGVFASPRRRLMMSESSEWEREVVAMEMKEDDDDIEGKTLSPPPRDLAQVLSEILTEEEMAEKSVDNPSANQKQCEGTDSEAEQTSAASSGQAPSETQDVFEQDTNQFTVDVVKHCETGDLCHVASEYMDQTEALNLSLTAVHENSEGLAQCDENRICDSLETAASGHTDKDDTVTSSQSHLETSIDEQHCDPARSQELSKNEKMDFNAVCDESGNLENQKPRESTALEDRNMDCEAATDATNALDEFIISPCRWPAGGFPLSHESSGVGSLGLLPMFDLPTLPSLHTAPSLSNPSTVPKPLLLYTQQGTQTPVSTPSGGDGYHRDNTSRSASVCSVGVAAIADAESRGFTSGDMDGDMVPSDQNLMQSGDNQMCPSDDSSDGFGAGYESAADSVNPQMWACFQQFNMAIACS